jgi:hypothetical protein
MRAGLVDEIAADLMAAERRWLRQLSRLPAGAAHELRQLTRADRIGDDGVAHGATVTAAMLEDPELRARLKRFAEEGVLPWESR